MRSLEDLDRAALESAQAEKLQTLLRRTWPANCFYARKFDCAGVQPSQVHCTADLRVLPFTTKAELLADQQAEPPYGSVLTYPRVQYNRLHQTSGTTGKPLCWLDTPESWQWMLACWQKLFQTAGIGEGDRLFFPFSFGPFLGFWTAFESAAQAGRFCLSGGGMTSAGRLRFMLDHQATVVLCTPTYALRLAEVARQEGIDLAGSAVRALIVAGEPGGSIPATRQRIESAWGARVFDHNGLTEVGPVGIECQESPGSLHLLESDYVVEVIDPLSGRPVSPGEIGELVLTNLGRFGSPVIRYRTGDQVRADPRPCPCGRPLVRLEGGIRGRTDDMILLRGNNLYPAAIEGLVHRFPEVAEFQIEIDTSAVLAELRIDIEPVAGISPLQAAELAGRIGQAIRDEFWFRALVTPVPPGTLPRFEMKAHRIKKK
jgi:phenylacetate-CoA ligase